MIRVARFSWLELAMAWKKDFGYQARSHGDRLLALLYPIHQRTTAANFEDYIRQFLLFPTSEEDRKSAVKKYKKSRLVVQVTNHNNDDECQTVSEFFLFNAATAASISQSLGMRTRLDMPKVAEVSIYLE